MAVFTTLKLIICISNMQDKRFSSVEDPQVSEFQSHLSWLSHGIPGARVTLWSEFKLAPCSSALQSVPGPEILGLTLFYQLLAVI